MASSNNNSSNETNNLSRKAREPIKRSRSVYAPLQQSDYGPKGTLKKINEENLLLIQDPLSQRLSWKTPPNVVLLIKKKCDTLFGPFYELIVYLVQRHNLTVYVEKQELENQSIEKSDILKKCIDKKSVHPFEVHKECLENKIDLVISLGGDGTLLHVSSTFQRSCPPVLALNMGSLGFLCPFEFDNYRTYIDSVVKGNVPLLLRNRLSCRLERSNKTASTNETNEKSLANGINDLTVNQNKNDWLVLNDIVINRGQSRYLSNLDLYLNDRYVTTVQGDGLIISTPTGSTAYAMAAGASMCHPSVPAIIICPICPHSLSFRPIVVPAGVDLRISTNSDARSSACCSVDGQSIGELSPGDNLYISSSEYPLPSICRTDQIHDWFEGLAYCLHWNQRKRQLPLDACYATDSVTLNGSSSSTSNGSSSSASSNINNNNNNKDTTKTS